MVRANVADAKSEGLTKVLLRKATFEPCEITPDGYLEALVDSMPKTCAAVVAQMVGIRSAETLVFLISISRM